MQAEYLKRWDVLPSPTALLTYDAITIVIDSLRQCGANRIDLRDQLARSTWQGASGPISWDNGGGNTRQPAVVHIKSIHSNSSNARN
jgi:ABC-type branched-subunit amino acid transport system substrate-binding protein